jgi:glycosyltransferase involved in cell wall biosynthesis
MPSVIILNHYERLGPRVTLEASALRKAGYEVRAIHWVDDEAGARDVAARGPDEDAVVSPKAGGPVRLRSALPAYYRRAWRKLKREQADFIHCTHIMLLPLAYALGRRLRAKVVYDVYEFYLIDAPQALPARLRWITPILRGLEAFFACRAAGILAIDSYGNWLERRYRDLNPNTVVLMNVPERESALADAPEALRRKYQGRRIVTYIGGMSAHKGVLHAVETLERVARETPNVLFLFIGLFHGDAEARFWDSVRRSDLEGHVEVIPWLPYEEMLQYLALTEVGLAPHQPIERYKLVGKGNGRKMFTYMQMGIPVVGPEFGGLGELIRDEGIGLAVDTSDPESTAAAVLAILRDPERAQEYSDHGRRAIRERYNWEQESVKLLRFYNALEEC